MGFVKLTDYTLYEDRLLSFKEPTNTKDKWNAKWASMVSMARSFFYFEPLKEQRDRTVCVECKAELSNWSKHTRKQNRFPLSRHVESAKQSLAECFVANLGALTLALQDAPTEVVPQQVRKACMSTFKQCDSLVDIKDKLASQGFFSMPQAEEKTETVGCVACLCYPQMARENPQHCAKCPIARIIARVNIDDAHSEERAPMPSIIPEKPDKLCESKREKVEPTNDDISQLVEYPSSSILDALLAQLQLPSSIINFERLSEQSCNSAFDKSKRDMCNQIQEITSGMTQNNGRAELEVLELLEDKLIQCLERAHATRISIISTETERVVRKIMQET